MQALITVRELTKRFGSHVAVDRISFDIAPGEIFACLGPNGAGKTTTIQMLTTLLRPDSGTILVGGSDPVLDPFDVRRRFGIVFQDTTLDGALTAQENLDLHGVLYGMPRRLRASRIEQHLKQFELWERRDSFVKEFSGGMKRRLEVARSLLHAPSILVLDEPTIGLDPQSRNQLWTEVRRANHVNRVTVFLTTHNMDEAERVADRIAVLDRGRIVAQGTPQELKHRTGTGSLEESFLALTGTALRDGLADGADLLRRIECVAKR